MSIQSILVAVDFGDASARAVAAGGAIAAHSSGASLRLLRAEIEARAYFTAEQVGDLERQRHAITFQVEQSLSRFGRQHTANPFTPTVDRRPAAESILAEAAAVDLVVMGTHGRHGPKRWWLGSVAERVLRDTPTPLLVLRASETDRASTPPDHLFDRTLVHASSALTGDRALTFAGVLASRFGGTVTDVRHQPIEPALERTQATLLVVAAPEPRTAEWTSNYGQPLVQWCTVPILFVPEPSKGDSL
jgi:nucleotide-binding universal stress UspA family protein